MSTGGTSAWHARYVPKWFDDLALIDAVAAMTLALITFFGFEQILFKLAAQFALLAIIIKPSLLRRFELWLVLALVASLTLYWSWSTSDNHKYLLVYWLWVVTLATAVSSESDAATVLRGHARFFIVFVFLGAALQKVASPTYMSGEMFELKLLLDERFKAFAHLIGIDRSIAETVEIEFQSLQNPLAVYDDNARLISSTDAVRNAAWWITWYDVVVQFIIGLLFVPGRMLTDRIGHAVLLAFIFTTYIAAPVFGFGWILAIYGVTLAKDRHPAYVILYAAAFVAILFYQSPWREWVLD